MIPTGWKLKPLSEVAIIQTGVAKGPKKLKNPVALPYLRVANVQDGYLDLTTIKTIEIDEAQINRYLLKVGDVLLTEGGDFDKLGRGTVWKGELDRCVHQNHVFVVRPKAGVLLSEYLSLLTGSPYGKLYFMKCSKQSTNLASINSTQLKEFPVLLPPVLEQTAIAELLFTWDNAIEKTERLIAFKEKRFRWLLNKLIYEESKRSNGQVAKLGELFGKDLVIEKGKPLMKDNITEGDIPVVAGGRTYAYYHAFSTHKIPTITVSASGAYAGFVWLHHYPIWASDCNVIYAINASIDFYYYVLKSQQERIYALQSGGAQPHVYAKDLKHLVVPVPPRTVQETIANTLNTARQEIDLLKKQAEAYRKQKRGLMQKLLTGTWRVSVEERQDSKPSPEPRRNTGSKEGAL